MPFPNEHACRLNNPNKYDRLRRKNCDQRHEGKCIDVIYGVKNNQSEIQALRYPKDIWSESAARTHCGDRGGTFEAASGEEDMYEGENAPEYYPANLAEELRDYDARTAVELARKSGLWREGIATIEKTGDLKRAPGSDEDVYTIVASTDAVDRYGEIVEPAGFTESLPLYLKRNPVVLWQHNWNLNPIGRSISGRITERALLLDIVWASTPLAKETRMLYDTGFMQSFSVGFLPIEYEEDEKGRWHWTKQELLEVSAVSIPANPEAIMQGMGEIVENALHQGLQIPILKSIYQRDIGHAAEMRKLSEAERLQIFYGAKKT